MPSPRRLVILCLAFVWAAPAVAGPQGPRRQPADVDGPPSPLAPAVITRDEKGGASAVRQVEVPLNIPRKEVLNALGQYYVYTLTLQMKPGLQHVAVAVRDEIAATTSYLSRPVTVNAAAAVSHR